MNILLALYLLVLIVVAAVCLFFPRTVQSRAIKAVGASRFRSLVAYVHSERYLLDVRFVGATCLVVAILLGIAMMSGS